MRPMIHFMLLRVPVSIHPSSWLALALLGWSLASPSVTGVALFVVAGFISTLTHEMGHALVGRWLAGGEPKVCLAWLGGDCCNAEAKFTRMQGVVMTAAGPLVSVAVGLLVVPWLMWEMRSVSMGAWLSVQFLMGVVPEGCLEVMKPSMAFFCAYMIQVSIWWAVMNLLPIFPLDGGQIMHGLMKSPRRMHGISMIVSTVVMLLFFLLRVPLAAICMGFLAYFNYRFYQHTPN